MSVALTTKAPEYYLQPFNAGIQRPVSTMELTSIYEKNNPKALGTVIYDDYEMDDSLFAELLAKGREFVFATDQVIWQEEDTSTDVARVTGNGAVTRTDNSFKINSAAIPSDPYDFNSERPTVAQWLQVKEGMHITVFDSAGKRANGVVTAIGTDKTTFTATPIGGAWPNSFGTSVEVYFLGNNLDHCELAPCIGYKKYKPWRQNTMWKDSECVEYCKETEIANGSDGVDAYPLFNSPDGDYTVDSRLEDAQKRLLARNENVFAFGVPLSSAEAAGGAVATKGAMVIIEERATKNQGTIDTLSDIKNLASQMRDKKYKKGTIRCSAGQYAKLLDLYTTNTTLSINPFDDNSNKLYSINFNGFRIGDIEIYFQRWSVLDEMGSFIGKRYHYLLIPEGRLRRKINNTYQDVGYLNIGWYGKGADVFKFLRDEDDKVGGKVSVYYINKFVPIVFHPEKFIMGMTA